MTTLDDLSQAQQDQANYLDQLARQIGGVLQRQEEIDLEARLGPASPMRTGSDPSGADVATAGTTDPGSTVVLAPGAVTAPSIAPGAVGAVTITPGTLSDLSLYSSSVRPVSFVLSLPALPSATYPAGSVVFLAEDGKLYRNDLGSWTRSTDGADIIANSITAGSLSSVLVLASLIKTSDAGARVELDSAGLRAYSSDGTQLVNIPTDGTSPVSFTGQVQATTLTAAGGAYLFGSSSIDKGATLTLQSGVQPPSAAPVLSQSLPSAVALAATTGWTIDGAGYYDAAGGADGATACYVAAQWNGATGFRVAEWNLSDMSLSRTTALTGYWSNGADTLAEVRGVTRIGSVWHMAVVAATGDAFVVQAARATGAFVSGTGNYVSLTAYMYTTTSVRNPIGTDGTYVYVAGLASPTSLRVARFNPSGYAVLSRTLTLPSAPSGATTGQVMVNDFTVADDGDGGGARWVLDFSWLVSGSWAQGRVYKWSTADGSLVANRDWLDHGLAPGAGLFWAGTAWRHASPTGPGITAYTSWDWSTASTAFWAAYSWNDSAGTTHETPVGPAASIALERRRRLSVSTSVIPVGGADDPDSVKVYMYQGASAPAGGGWHLQSTDALTARTLTTYAGGGAADGAGTPFAGGTGAVLKSSTGLFTLKGDGSLLFGGAAFPSAPATSQHAYRTDLGMWFYWDGTRWLSEQIFEATARAVSAVTEPVAATAAGKWWASTADAAPHGSWLVSCITDFNVVTGGTALGASNKWDLTLSLYPSATALAATSIASGASAAWRRVTTAIGAAQASTDFGALLTWTKTGTPGALTFNTRITYRVIAT